MSGGLRGVVRSLGNGGGGGGEVRYGVGGWGVNIHAHVNVVLFRPEVNPCS